MNKSILFMLFYLLLGPINNVYCQYDSLWTRTYGGALADRINDIEVALDNGHIMAGYTSSFGPGKTNGWLLKIDSAGDTLWTHAYGGAGYTRFYGVESVGDSGYIAIGHTSILTEAVDYNIWLVRVDNEGDTLITRQYGDQFNDISADIIALEDGGFLVCGRTEANEERQTDAFLLRITSNLDTLWNRTYGGTGHDRAISIDQASDGGFLLAGYFSEDDNQSASELLLKIDASGNELWRKSINDDMAYSEVSSYRFVEGKLFVLGHIKPPDSGVVETWIKLIDETGDTIWTKTVAVDLKFRVNDVLQTPDGKFLLAGSTKRFYDEHHYDAALATVDSFGAFVSMPIFGGNNYDSFSAISPAVDGYILAGSTASFGAGSEDGYVVRITEIDNEPPTTFSLLTPEMNSSFYLASGNADSILFSWTPSADSDGDSVTYLLEFINLHSETFLEQYITGDTTLKLQPVNHSLLKASYLDTSIVKWRVSAWDTRGNLGYSNENMRSFYLVSENSAAVDDAPQIPTTMTLHANYPNPFNPVTTIRYELPTASQVTLTVYDISGREVVRLTNGHMDAGFHNVVWNGVNGKGRSVPSGIYIARMVMPEYTKSIKMLLLK